MTEPIYAEIDIQEILCRIPDRDKLAIIKILIEEISEEGFIGPIRELVNNLAYND